LRDRAYARVAIILARRGQEKAGLVALARISNAGRRDDAMADMGIVLARRGQRAETERIAASLDPYRRDQVRAVVAMVLGEAGDIHEGRIAANRIDDLPRRRDAMVALRAGLARSMTANVAEGYARGAETPEAQVLAMMGVARRLIADGKPAEALPALSWADQYAKKSGVGSEIVQQVAADTALLLMEAGDIAGARAAAGDVADGGVGRLLLRQIDTVRQFSP
ncbi:MAG: hypothetical protein VW405_09820, partial [Rhodospirillaceae bacterium]